MDVARLYAQLLSSKLISQDDTEFVQNKDKERINVDEPLWDQQSYIGRWKHFAFITDFRTIFFNEKRLIEAKKLCEDYKAGREPIETTREDVIWAKKLKDSSFHPDNGELMSVIGRMSFQLPGCLILTSGMLGYHKTTKAVLGWQVLNQGFNAIVNHTNRNARNENRTQKNIIQEAFVMATIAGCATALTLRRIMSRRGELAKHWAPFVAVASANIVNLPIMRQNEIKNGIDISAKESEKNTIMKSKVAALKGISECIVSRIVMAAPGMMLVPLIMKSLKPYCLCQIRPWLDLPVQTVLCGIFLVVMIPTALAIYPQRNSMRIRKMKLCTDEYEEYQKLTKGIPDTVYYNKGL